MGVIVGTGGVSYTNFQFPRSDSALRQVREHLEPDVARLEQVRRPGFMRQSYHIRQLLVLPGDRENPAVADCKARSRTGQPVDDDICGPGYVDVFAGHHQQHDIVGGDLLAVQAVHQWGVGLLARRLALGVLPAQVAPGARVILPVQVRFRARSGSPTGRRCPHRMSPAPSAQNAVRRAPGARCWCRARSRTC